MDARRQSGEVEFPGLRRQLLHMEERPHKLTGTPKISYNRTVT